MVVKIEFTPLLLDRKIFPFKKGFKKLQKQLNCHVPDFPHVGHIGSAFGRKFYWSKKS